MKERKDIMSIIRERIKERIQEQFLLVLFIDKYTCAKRNDKEVETNKSDKKDRQNIIQME